MLKLNLLAVACLLFGVAVQAYSIEDISSSINWTPIAEGAFDVIPVPTIGSGSISSGSSEEVGLVQRCPAPNNGGLRPLMLEIRPLLPANRLKHMVRSALKWDSQMRSLQQLVRTPHFRANVNALRSSPEFAQLRTIVCERMYLDLKQYSKFVRTLFNIKTTPDSVELWDSDEMLFNGRPGWTGLIQDIIDVLPRTQLRALYERRIQNDVDLSRAIEYLKSAEFRQVLADIRARPEYQELQRMVNAIGIRLGDLQKVIDYALGRDGEKVDLAVGGIVRETEVVSEELLYLVTL